MIQPSTDPQAIYHFPRGFLWGCATAAHQVEGNNTNSNWWQWEQADGHILNKQVSGLACDWWGGRWREDLDRAMETGQNATRLSVEWSRIQPAPDRWDENALDYYRQILRGCVERGLTPMVTLHHFSNPIWLEEQGGWENPDTPNQFDRFVHKTVEALQEYANLWVTINEPNVYAYCGYVQGVFPPGKTDLNTAFAVFANLVRGHALAYKTIHAIQPQARVGIALNYRGFVPNSISPLDKLVAGIQSRLYNGFFPRALTDGVLDYVTRKETLPAAAHTQDFLGINYYTRDRVAFDSKLSAQGYGRLFFPKDADLSDTGFIANDPEGMFEALQWGMRFKIPMLVTENGVECADDHLRPRYLAQHIHQVWRAVNLSMPVKGYFHWSLVDNFEWERGWTQRFGLWELDVETQARRRRPSADLYEAICRENGLSTAMVDRWCPEVREKIFPA